MKFLAIFVATFLIFQAESAKLARPQIHEHIPQVQSIWDDIKAFLKSIDAAITELIKEAKLGLLELEKEVTKIKDEVVKEAANEIIGVEEEIKKALDEIKKNSTKPEKDVIDCIESEYPDLEKLPAEALNNTGKCITVNVNTVLNAIETIVVAIDEKYVIVRNLTGQLEECLESSSPLTCATQIVADIVRVVGELEDIVKKDIEVVKKDVQELPENLKHCIAEETSDMKKKAKEIFDKIATCIENK